MKKTFAILTALVACTLTSGCTPKDTKEAVPQQTGAGEALEYRTVYESAAGDLQVREAFLGSLEDWDWGSFAIPAARIQDAVQELGLRGACETTAEFEVSGWCTDTVRIKDRDGKEQRFDLFCDHMDGGFCLLKKGGELVWQGDLVAATCGPVLSSRKTSDGIAIDYVTQVPAGFGTVINSVLLIQGSEVLDIVEATRYDAAFAPNEIRGRLAYFARQGPPGAKTVLVFDGKVVAEYDAVFDQHCCWDGPPIQVRGNGDIVDFFAQKDGGWYHVQAASR